MTINLTNELLKPLCKRWASQKLKAWGRTSDDPITVHWLSGKLHGRPIRRATLVAEFPGESSVIESALSDMDERPRLVLHTHYMVRPDRGKLASSDCGISEAQYWQELNCAYAFIAGRMSVSGILEKAAKALRLNGSVAR